MPYIIQDRRKELDYSIAILCKKMKSQGLTTAGDLNYVLTRILASTCLSGLSYESINTTIGILECMKQEIYRRVAVPYEEYKKRTNGDVF